jgi:hypothetical protein
MMDKIIIAAIVIIGLAVFFKLAKFGLKLAKLLITLVVGLLLFMYIFEIGFFGQPEECDAVSLSIIDEMPTCYNQDKIFLNFNNSGKAEIIGMRAEITGSANLKKVELDDTFDPESEELVSVDYDAEEFGEPQKLKFTPKILIGEEEKECKDKTVEIIGIRSCES